MNFAFVQQVCYDTGNALLEYGHHPRPQILHVKKSTTDSPEIYDSEKIVQQVCSGTGKSAQIQVERSCLVA